MQLEISSIKLSLVDMWVGIWRSPEDILIFKTIEELFGLRLWLYGGHSSLRNTYARAALSISS